MTNVEQAAEVATLTESLLRAVAAETRIDDLSVKVGLCIGVSAAPSDGVDAATLVANAEAALYRAKSEGRGVARFFEAEMEKALRERRALEHELKVAIAHDQLRLHYQPQTDVAGVLLGFEALLRWFHPSRGLIPPSVFIPIAEESGLDWRNRDVDHARSVPGGRLLAGRAEHRGQPFAGSASRQQLFLDDSRGARRDGDRATKPRHWRCGAIKERRDAIDRQLNALADESAQGPISRLRATV